MLVMDVKASKDIDRYVLQAKGDMVLGILDWKKSLDVF